MIYESSYESGRVPFVPDLNRGHWSKVSDFVFAGLALSYRMDIMQLSDDITVTSLLPILTISLALYTVPLLMIQSFMGQFSSSGFISSFRISPIFKGIGYVSLALNVLVLIFYSPFAMIPLVYLMGSLKPKLPWCCDGVYGRVEFCNTTLEANSSEDVFDFDQFFKVPSSAYFDSIFYKINVFGFKFTFSWHLILAAFCIWFIVLFVTYKCKNISKIGEITRYTVRSVVVLMILLIIRLSFVPGIGTVFSEIFTPDWNDFIDGIMSIPTYGISAFGQGWGLILTLASFNKFNTNIQCTSWLIGIGHAFMITLYSVMELLINESASLLVHEDIRSESKRHLALFLTGGSVFASMKWANFWSIIFYSTLVLAGIIIMIIQFNIILYSIFDEFVSLRRNRTKVSFGLLAAMAMFSLYFSTEHGCLSYLSLRFDTLITQSLIDLLVILAVLWIYGRQRFQRDLEFMINERFATWKVFVLRFLAPVVLLIALAQGLLISIFHSIFAGISTTVFNLLLRPLPWLCVPGYVIYCLLKSKGSFKSRLLKSARPTDWYPVEVHDRQKYEEYVDNANMTHPLNILDNDNNI